MYCNQHQIVTMILLLVFGIVLKTVDEYGNEQDVGINGFKGYPAKWHQHR